MTPEGRVTAEIRRWFQLRSYPWVDKAVRLEDVVHVLRSDPRIPGVVVRANTGAFKGEYKGKRRFVKYGVNGQTDCFVFQRFVSQGECLIGNCRLVKAGLTGIVLRGLEIKAEGGVVSPDQSLFHEMLRLLGGVGAIVVARSAADVEAAGVF